MNRRLVGLLGIRTALPNLIRRTKNMISRSEQLQVGVGQPPMVSLGGIDPSTSPPAEDDKTKLLPYYQSVRQTIHGLDAQITALLTAGSTATVTILIAPLAVFKTSPQDINWTAVFLVSLFFLPVTLYLLTTLALYADLLRRAVGVAKGLESEILSPRLQPALLLTTQLEENPLAGGKLGPMFYLILVGGLYAASSGLSAIYFFQFIESLVSDYPRRLFSAILWLCILLGFLFLWIALLVGRRVVVINRPAPSI